MKMKIWALSAVVVSIVGLAAAKLALDRNKHAMRHDDAMQESEAAPSAERVKPYPLDYCVVSGDKLGGEMGEPFVIVHEGREIKFCCKGCVKDFNEDPASFLAKIDSGVDARNDVEVSMDMPKDATHDAHGEHQDANASHEGHDHE
jgi:hypothetical protein